MKIHIVQKGDTLWKLAKKYNVDFEQLKAANNHLSNPDMIMPGMKIKIPTGSVPVKKEQPLDSLVGMAKKEAPIVKKEAPVTPPVKEKPKVAPKPPEKPKQVPMPEMPPMMMPTAPPPQPMTAKQMQEFNMNFNIYKPQPYQPPKPKEAPKPPVAPKAEKPKEMVKPEMPKKKPVMPKEQPKMMPHMQPMVPCPPYYPISPVLPGCAPCGSGNQWLYGQQQNMAPYYGQQVMPGMMPSYHMQQPYQMAPQQGMSYPSPQHMAPQQGMPYPSPQHMAPQQGMPYQPQYQMAPQQGMPYQKYTKPDMNNYDPNTQPIENVPGWSGMRPSQQILGMNPYYSMPGMMPGPSQPMGAQMPHQFQEFDDVDD
ncbi:SafA/ExsA family spore coat assembly protein [Alkalihalobacillus sp. BA299]|uniref:SafA/ExsA family spore coat assembly protein n=1 Tax=Alkalihalobacillus sp. BA299 TaxID=2815938 RepID=UPI001ADCD6BA|nr:SafA/ExsA family spore coat assembly protein [Alkalihalobacillus sp. BA299]